MLKTVRKAGKLVYNKAMLLLHSACTFVVILNLKSSLALRSAGAMQHLHLQHDKVKQDGKPHSSTGSTMLYIVSTPCSTCPCCQRVVWIHIHNTASLCWSKDAETLLLKTLFLSLVVQLWTTVDSCRCTSTARH